MGLPVETNVMLELEIADLKSEITSLKNIIITKNTDIALLKNTVNSQKSQLSKLQGLADSYNRQVMDILSPDKDLITPDKDLINHDKDILSPDKDFLSPYKDILTPPATENSRCDTSSDNSISTPFFQPRAAVLPEGAVDPPPLEVPPPNPSTSTQQNKEHSYSLLSPKPSAVVASERPSAMLVVSPEPLNNNFRVSPRRLATSACPSTILDAPPAGSGKSCSAGRLTCPICNKQFTNLNLHLTVKHKQNPSKGKLPTYKCPHCKRTVRHENEKKHMKKVHAEECSEEEYDVEKVINVRKEGVNMVYQVRWTLGDTTWEPEGHLTNCRDKIEEFWQERKLGKKIRIQVRTIEVNPRGKAVPGVRMNIYESADVRRVKTKYCKTLDLCGQVQLFKGGARLEDHQVLKGMMFGSEGEVLMATGLTFKK